jgi:hypothetical protein
MNKKQETAAASLVIVGIALLATITMVSPTQALALGHWNLDEDSTPDRDVAENGMDSSGTSDNTDEEEEDSGDEEEEDRTTAATTDEDEVEEGSEDSTDNSNDEDSSSSGYEAFQACLAEIEESPTEENVQDCIESSYGGDDENEDAAGESTDEGDKGDTDVTQEYEPRTVG